MSSAANHFAAIRKQLCSVRRETAARSPKSFAGIYLRNHLVLPPSSMHEELFKELARTMKKRGGRVAIAAPRGHAKSTIVSLAFVLWCVLFDKEKLVLIVSATRDQAVLLLKAIKDELRNNALLQEDFPEVCRTDGTGPRPKPWRDNRIQLPNGAMVCAYGFGQGLRGAKHGKDRPGLIVVDDIENREQVISEEQRRKLHDWFHGTLLKAGHPATNVVVVGTILHHDSLLANLIGGDTSRGWHGMLYRAIISHGDHPELWENWAAIYRGLEDIGGLTGPETAEASYRLNRDKMLEGTEVLWPEFEDYHELMVMIEREGRASFQAEKQNEPLDPEQCIFSESGFHFWDDEYGSEQALIKALGSGGRFFGACDPSLGHRTGQGDFTAIVILAQDRETEVQYVIAADIARRSPDATIDRIVHYARLYKFDKFAVEGNHFQELMVDNLKLRARQQCVSMNIETITNRSNKRSRIAGIEPDVCQGRVQFSRRHQLLLDQLRQFPLGKHDDGPDALEMAVELARRPRNVTTVEYLNW